MNSGRRNWILVALSLLVYLFSLTGKSYKMIIKHSARMKDADNSYSRKKHFFCFAFERSFNCVWHRMKNLIFLHSISARSLSRSSWYVFLVVFIEFTAPSAIAQNLLLLSENSRAKISTPRKEIYVDDISSDFLLSVISKHYADERKAQKEVRREREENSRS